MAYKKKVSVILTSYNHAKFLRESIDSVLQQSFRDFELIIRDDASTDESWQIITSYSDPRIRAFRNETNIGGGNIRAALAQGATGEYIAIHHSDDVWEPQKLEKQVVFLDHHPDIGAVFTQAYIIGENGEPFEDKTHFYFSIFEQPNRSRHEWLNHFFYVGNALCHPSVLIRKVCYDSCGPYRYGFAQVPDLDMWVRLCLKYDIHILPEKLVRFRVRTNDENESGDRGEARSRGKFELLQIYDNYNHIKNPEEFIKIFPNTKNYFKPEGFDIGFALGMAALEADTVNAINLFGLTLLFKILNDPERAKTIKELYGFSHKDFIALTAKSDVFSTETITNLATELVEQNQYLQKLTDQINEKEQYLQVLNEQMQVLNEYAQALNEQTQALTEQLNEQTQALNAQIAEKEQFIQVLKWQLAEKEQAVQALTNKITEIEKSKTWKLALVFRRIRLRTVPPDSLRARLLRRILNFFVFGLKRATPPIPNDEADLALVRSSGLFDESWYLSKNPDIANANIDPVQHYLLYGGQEGRDPGPNFSSDWYLNAYQDIKAAGINPLVHYIKFGRDEGRKSLPDLAAEVLPAQPGERKKGLVENQSNLNRSEEPSQNISQLALQENRFPSISRDPIIVHQIGKVGSKTVELSLQKAYAALGINVPIYHTHALNNFEFGRQLAVQEQAQRDPASRLAALAFGESVRKLIDTNPDQHWNIVSLVRDPIARNLAEFFHNLNEYIPDWHERNAAGRLDAHELQAMFLSIMSKNDRTDFWFDAQIKSVPAIDIDVFEAPFPHAAGYKIYPGARQASLLVIRLENLNECAGRAMHTFLGFENFTLYNTNTSDAKDYTDLYRAFKEIPLPAEYVEGIYKTQFARHFYSDIELDGFTKRWTKNEKHELEYTFPAEPEKVQPGRTLPAGPDEKEQSVQALTAQIAEKEQSVQALSAQVGALIQDEARLKDTLKEKENEIDNLKVLVASIYRSTSWKLTRPVRDIKTIARKLITQTPAAVKADWKKTHPFHPRPATQSRKISVIVTSYNHEKYITQCLDGILMQKGFFSLEIVLGDDCSPDGTPGILARYMDLHPEIMKMMSNEQNLGVAKNLKRCLQACTGDYIAICEGDDYWTDEYKLQKQMELLEDHADYSMCFSALMLNYEDRNQIEPHPGQQSLVKDFITTEDLIDQNYIGNFSCCMYRTEVVRKLPEGVFDLFAALDWIFHMACGEIGKIGFLHEPMSVYRIHSKGAWSGKREIEKLMEVRQMLEVYDEFLDFRYAAAFTKSKKVYDDEILRIREIEDKVKIITES